MEQKNGTEEALRRRIGRLEALRRWMLVLATALLLGGYVSALKPVLWATVLPLLAAMLVTYRIKYLEESAEK